MLIDEDIFMALVRKGHSLIKLTVKLRSMKLLKKVIEVRNFSKLDIKKLRLNPH